MMLSAMVIVFDDVVAAHLKVHCNLFDSCQCFALGQLFLLLLLAAGQGLSEYCFGVCDYPQCNAPDD